MSAEEEKDLAGDAGETEAGEPAAEKAAAKKPAAKAEAEAEQSSARKEPVRKRLSRRKKPAATSGEKPADTREPMAPKEHAPDEEPAATKEPATAKEPAAAKEPQAAKEPAAGKEPAAAKEPKAAKTPAAPGKMPLRRKPPSAQGPRRRVVRAHARYVRTSARKARMVCGHLRGKSVQEARAILAFTPREVARDWSKLLESAVANAESNHELLEDDLIVREAYADEGPTIKRFRARAMGRAAPIRKRTSHLTIALAPGPDKRTTKKQS